MRIKEKQDELFAELRKADPTIVDDGVVDEDKYLNATYKILYILKEVNGGEGWSLINDVLAKGDRTQSWDNIARWTEAILNLYTERDWADWTRNNERRRKEYLKKIAVINLKKTSGGYVANMKAIGQAAIDNQLIIKNQIKLYRPDIIICCGTGYIFKENYYKDIPLQTTSRGVDYFVAGETKVILFSHPAARVPSQYLHFALLDAVKEIFKIGQ